MKKKVVKDTPLAEITLRKYERPINLSEREIIRKICLSLGLLQPGDSRNVIVDVLHVFLKHKRELDSKEIEELVKAMRKEHKLPMLGVASSNIRRQIKRLRDMYLVEKVANKYRMAENEHLVHLFEEKIETFYLRTIVDRVKDYLRELK